MISSSIDKVLVFRLSLRTNGFGRLNSLAPFEVTPMISRYSRPEMAAIWSDANRYRLWYEIEAYACEARVELGQMDAAIVRALWNSQPETIDIDRIREIESAVHHESIAFQMYVAEICPQIANERYHHGLTSSDILDTCFSVQLVRAAELICDQVHKLHEALKLQALRYKYTPCMGRSHGVHGEPITFGLRLARACAEVRRNLERMDRARQEVTVGMVSGPMGNYSNLDTRIEEYVCQKLGLNVETVSSQVIPRDRHAMYFATLGVIAASIERLAVELRQLQMTEIGEIAEPFSADQKGSSAMPHKKNPILLENVTGLARMIKSCVGPALDNVVLWQERDMSHSSVERFIGPDATITLDFALHRLIRIVSGLSVNENQMLANMGLLRGLPYSQNVLLALIEKGIEKDVAYRWVQQTAFRTMNKHSDFLTELAGDKRIQECLDPDQLARLLEPWAHTRDIDRIFERTIGQIE